VAINNNAAKTQCGDDSASKVVIKKTVLSLHRDRFGIDDEIHIVVDEDIENEAGILRLLTQQKHSAAGYIVKFKNQNVPRALDESDGLCSNHPPSQNVPITNNKNKKRGSKTKR